MPFVVVGQLGPRMRQVDGDDRLMGRVNFGCEYGTKSKLAFTRNLLKCNSGFDFLLRKQQTLQRQTTIDFSYRCIVCGKHQQVIFSTGLMVYGYA